MKTWSDYDNGRQFGHRAGEHDPNDPQWNAENLLGFAHGLEDAAYRAKSESNRKRAAAEESEWGRFLAL